MLKVSINLNMILKVRSPITNIIFHDLQTFDKIGASPYCRCLYQLIKISGN